MIDDLLWLSMNALEAGLIASDVASPSTDDSQHSRSEFLTSNPVYEPDEIYDLASLVIDKDPSQAQAWFLRGVACQAMQCHEEALADLTEAIRLDPAHARARLLRSEIHFRLGDDEQGMLDRQRALELDPSLSQ